MRGRSPARGPRASGPSRGTSFVTGSNPIRWTGFPDGDFRRDLLDALGEEDLRRVYEDGLRLEYRDAERRATPGVVLGMHVSVGNQRQKDGSYRPILGPRGYWWMPKYEVILTAVPVDSAVSIEPESAALRVVNEFVSGVFLIDDKRIIIPLEVGQNLLHLDEAQIVDEDGEETGFVDPAGGACAPRVPHRLLATPSALG